MGIGPESEKLRKALQWAGEERLLEPDRPLRILYETVCLRFDLTPMECDALYQLMFLKPEENS